MSKGSENTPGHGNKKPAPQPTPGHGDKDM